MVQLVTRFIGLFLPLSPLNMSNRLRAGGLGTGDTGPTGAWHADPTALAPAAVAGQSCEDSRSQLLQRGNKRQPKLLSVFLHKGYFIGIGDAGGSLEPLNPLPGLLG